MLFRSIIMWETGESNLMSRLSIGPPFNDGSSFPFEWLSERHGASGRKLADGTVIGNGGASVGCVDGHVEWMSYKDYQAELEKPVRRSGLSLPSIGSSGRRIPSTPIASFGSRSNKVVRMK